MTSEAQALCIANEWRRCKGCPTHYEPSVDRCMPVGECMLAEPQEPGNTDMGVPAPPKVPADVVTEAFTAIVGDRDALYGHPSEAFETIARLKEVVAVCSDPKVRHTLDMICVKMARLVRNPGHQDSWGDIAGYARIGAMLTNGK